MPADYQILGYVVSRLRYYEGQFLTEQDFVDDQKHHIDARRRHERLLHVAGILEGLDVTANAGATGIDVAPGSAVDDQGRQILLGQTQSIAALPGASGTFVVAIAFAETPTDKADPNSPIQDFTRFTQTPAPVSIQPALPAGALLLAEIDVAAGQIVNVDTSKRVYSGVRLPGPGGAGIGLAASGDAAPGWAKLGGSLSVTGALSVGSISHPANMASGSLTIGDVGASFGGGTHWNGSTAGLLLETAQDTEIAVHDASARLAGLMYYEGGATNRLTIGRDMGDGPIGTVVLNGNVGVGTAAPTARLDVAGDANVVGNVTVAGNVACAGSVGIGTTTPDASAVLHMTSSDKGALVPQVALTARDLALPVTLPAAGLLVFNTAVAGAPPNDVSPGFYYWNGAEWLAFLSSSSFGMPPIGSIIAWHKSFANTPALPSGWVECNGQVLDNPASVYHGQTIPDLNNAPGYAGGRFLRGGTVSGSMQDATRHLITGSNEGTADFYWARGPDGVPNNDGSFGPGANMAVVTGSGTAWNNSARTAASRPVNMSVVYIMRVQ